VHTVLRSWQSALISSSHRRSPWLMPRCRSPWKRSRRREEEVEWLSKNENTDHAGSSPWTALAAVLEAKPQDTVALTDRGHFCCESRDWGYTCWCLRFSIIWEIVDASFPCWFCETLKESVLLPFKLYNL